MISCLSYITNGNISNNQEKFFQAKELLHNLEKNEDQFINNNDYESKKVSEIKKLEYEKNYYKITIEGGYETIISGDTVWIEGKAKTESERLWYTGDLLYKTWNNFSDIQKRNILLRIASNKRNSVTNIDVPEEYYKKSVMTGLVLAALMYNESEFSFTKPLIRLLYNNRIKSRYNFGNTGMSLIFSYDNITKMKADIISKSIKSESYTGKELLQSLNNIFTPSIKDKLDSYKDYGIGIEKDMDEVMYNFILSKLDYISKFTFLQKLITYNALVVGDNEAEKFKVKDKLMAKLLITLAYHVGRWGKYEYDEKENIYIVDLSHPRRGYESIKEIEKIDKMKEDCISFKIDRDEFICDQFILSVPH